MVSTKCLVVSAVCQRYYTPCTHIGHCSGTNLSGLHSKRGNSPPACAKMSNQSPVVATFRSLCVMCPAGHNFGLQARCSCWILFIKSWKLKIFFVQGSLWLQGASKCSSALQNQGNRSPRCVWKWENVIPNSFLLAWTLEHPNASFTFAKGRVYTVSPASR